EARAAELISRLDALGPAPALPLAAPAATATAAPWTRRPTTLVVGSLAVLALGIGLGVGLTRYTAPGETMVPPGSRLPVPTLPDPGPLLPGAPGTGAAGMKQIPPEMLARMLAAARQSLFEGRYQEAIAAYQAVLKRDPKNVDAMTHLGLIVAMGGYADAALETFEKALALDPKYGRALLYKGQALYQGNQDVPGARRAREGSLTRTRAVVGVAEGRGGGAALSGRPAFSSSRSGIGYTSRDPAECRAKLRARRGPREAAARGVCRYTLRAAADRERGISS